MTNMRRMTIQQLYGLQVRARKTIGDTVSQSFDGVEYSVRYHLVKATPTAMFRIDGKRVSHAVWYEHSYDCGWPGVPASTEVAA